MGNKLIDNRMALAIKYNSGRGLDKKLFKIESQMRAEMEIESTRTGNPISDAITGNKIWNDHLRRAGVRK